MTNKNICTLINQIKARAIKEINQLFDDALIYINGFDRGEHTIKKIDMQELSNQFMLYSQKEKQINFTKGEESHVYTSK